MRCFHILHHLTESAERVLLLHSDGWLTLYSLFIVYWDELHCFYSPCHTVAVRPQGGVMSAAFPPVMSSFSKSALSAFIQRDVHLRVHTHIHAECCHDLSVLDLGHAEKGSHLCVCVCVQVHSPCALVRCCSLGLKASKMCLPCYEIHPV